MERSLIREAAIAWGIGVFIGAPIAFGIALALHLSDDATFGLGVVCGMLTTATVLIVRACRS